MIVVDTNVLAYFFINGEFSKAAECVFSRDPQWAAPLLWRSEFRSVLVKCIAKNSLGLEDAVDIMRAAELLMTGCEYAVPSLDVLRLAASSRCSAYDAEFVALAREAGLKFVTVDADLQRAFPGIAVSPERFLRDA